jgi:hypothetical protein
MDNNKRIRLVIARLLALSMALTALAAKKGPDGGGYTATDEVVFSFVDLAVGGGSASVLTGVDDGVVPLIIPFPFRFYGTPYTVVCVSANGALYFVPGADACSGINDFGNVDITTTATPKELPAALPLWSDLTFEVPGAGAVLYQTIGALGSRRFVIQWQNAYPHGASNPVTFQVVLAELVHTLTFQYQSVGAGVTNAAANGGAATVGIRNTQGPSAKQVQAWSFNAPVLTDNSALSFVAPLVKVVGDVDGNGEASCADLLIVRASYGKRAGQPGFDPRADLRPDGVINLLDLNIVSRALPAGTRCS